MNNQTNNACKIIFNIISGVMTPFKESAVGVLNRNNLGDNTPLQNNQKTGVLTVQELEE